MNKMSYKFHLLLTILLLSGCVGEKQDNNSALNPHVISNPTLSAMYYSSEPTSDGVLTLEIEETEKTCYSMQDTIPIRYFFRNLSNDIVIIPVFRQDGVGLTPVLTSQVDYLYYNPEYPRDFISPKKTSLVYLSSNQTYEDIYEYRLPKYLSIYHEPDDIQISTPFPGNYLIKFVFETYQDYDSGAWKGSIASNQINICVKE